MQNKSLLERGKDMAVRTEVLNLKDALVTIMYTQEALIKLFVRKGIITDEELLEEIKKIRRREDAILTKN